MTRIIVCTTCRRPEQPDDADPRCGARLLTLLTDAAPADAPFEVLGVACLMGCGHGCNVAVADPTKMQYVLGDFEPTTEAASAILEYAAAHAASPTGVVPYRDWPTGVKGHFKARIPTLDEA